MIGNDFQGNALGVTCPYWADKSWRTLFIARSPLSGNSFDYNNGFVIDNNTGNCPKCHEFYMFSQPNVQYMFKTDLDEFATDSMYFKVAGDITERVWLVYRANDTIGTTNILAANRRMIRPSVAERWVASASYVGNISNKPLYGWTDSWVSDAEFCLHTYDTSYTGTRDLDELDDWFKARVILHENDRFYNNRNVTDLAFMLG